MAANRFDVEGNEDDVLHSCRYYPQIDKFDVIAKYFFHVENIVLHSEVTRLSRVSIVVVEFCKSLLILC